MAVSLSVKITKNDIERLKNAAPRAADTALRALAYVGLAHAKLLMDESPADGREYTRGGITHIASSPGSPPRPDTGALMGSLEVEPIQNGYEIHDGVEYGVFLEFGTTEIAPRPFMTPTVVHMEQKAAEVFDEFLK